MYLQFLSLYNISSDLNLKNPLVISPDQGGKERAKEFAKELGSEYIALEKKRDRKNGESSDKNKEFRRSCQ